jgi:mevalonate kinase
MAFRSVQGSVHYPAAIQLLDSLSAQLQLKLSDQEEHLIFTTSSQHDGGGSSCGDVAVCSVFNLTATPSDQSRWIADQQLLVSAAKIVCNSGETTITKVVVDLEAAAAAAQQQETVEPTGRNFGWTADFF